MLSIRVALVLVTRVGLVMVLSLLPVLFLRTVASENDAYSLEGLDYDRVQLSHACVYAVWNTYLSSYLRNCLQEYLEDDRSYQHIVVITFDFNKKRFDNFIF